MNRLTAASLVLLVACQGSPTSQSSGEPSEPDRPNTSVIVRGTGGSVTTNLGYGIKVNPNSSLEREWITINDSLAPVALVGNVGVATVYTAGVGYSNGGYNYRASVPVTVREDVAAIEVRFVVFNIWGEWVKTLTMTQVEDLAAGTSKTFTPKWDLYSENEVEKHYASIGYVARVRTKTGRIFEANYLPVIEEARKLNSKFDPDWLDPVRRAGADTTRSVR